MEPPRTHISETELLRRLDAWLASRGGTATFGDVLATRDAHLFAAFVLRRFRAAARAAVFDRFRREAHQRGFAGADLSTGAFLYVIDRIAEAWSLTPDEKASLLGLPTAAEVQPLPDVAVAEITPETLERGAILFDIFAALAVLLPQTDAADRWIRAPNTAPMFNGRSALAAMLDGGLREMRRVRAYVRAEAAGN